MFRGLLVILSLGTLSCGQVALWFRDKDDPRPRTCGNGEIDFRVEKACPPCAPDSGGCDCVDHRRQLDDCDGADLGGKSCASVGYLGGKLQCSRMCRLVTSTCQAVADAAAPEISFEATNAAIGARGGRLAIVHGTNALLILRHLDPKTLAWVDRPRGISTTVGPAGENSYGPLLLLPGEASDLVAVHQYGNLGQTYAYRSTPDLAWRGEPVAVGNAKALAPGAWGLSWLVVEAARPGFPLDVLPLDSDGRPLGTAIPAITHDWPYSGNHAAAVWTGAELVVVAGSNGNAPARNLRVARISGRGELLSSRELPFEGSQVGVAAESNGTVHVVATRGTQAYAFTLGPNGAVSQAVTLGEGAFSGPIVVSAGRTLRAWLGGFGKLYRAESPEGSLTVAAAIPSLRFAGGVPTSDGLIAVLGDAKTFSVYALR